MASEATQSRGEIVRDAVSKELARDEREVATSAAIAKARAEVEAPYTIARHFPRSWLDVRTKLLKELDRFEYAKACVFSRIQGKKQDEITGRWVDNVIEGLSIRFAESAMAMGGNMRSGSEIQYDDSEKRIYRVAVVDLETNAIGDASIVIEKTVERRGDGAEYRTIVRSRKNTAGDVVHICEATEDEITLKANNAASKAKRNLILALMPPDVKDDCLTKAKAVILAKISDDPNAERKRIADGFARLNVFPAALAEYLGHPLEQCSPATLALLAGLYSAINAGEATWHELVAEKAKPEPEQLKTTKGRRLAEEIRARKAQGVANAPKADDKK
jgi:hypothetical protein